jgi:hypothetical protein
MRRAYATLCVLLLGCDPTAGISDSADAALPPIKRYFDGRGTQVADGPWSRVVVDLDADTLYHVGGRRLDDDQPTFHLFGADARDGCQVTPNAGTWLMGKPSGAPFRVLPFLESIDERGRGRLRFTELDCTVQELALEDAGRPYPRLYDHGYLVPTKGGYTFADPWLGKTREIAEELRSVLIWNSSVLLWADDTLKSFSQQFEPGSQWGNAPLSVVQIQDDFLVEDADGLHRLRFDRDSLELSAEPVLSDACHLQYSNVVSTDVDDTAWVVAEQPCGNDKPSILHLNAKTFEELDSLELPFAADARYARPLMSAGVNPGDPPQVGALYMTDVDDDGLGTVWAWRAESEQPVQLGEHANLDAVFLEATSSDWDGVAQVNYRELGGLLAHDWIHFRWDGSTEPIAERVVRNSSSGETLVNFDGVAGDLPKFDEDGYRVLAKGVPAYSGETTSYVGDRHYARVDQFDGSAGRLLLGTESNNPASWAAVGNGVPPELARFAWFMPALVFVEDWDSESHTGRLVAYNYELDARAVISERVSSFDLTSYPWDGVVYSVPSGKQRGIWFSKAK